MEPAPVHGVSKGEAREPPSAKDAAGSSETAAHDLSLEPGKAHPVEGHPVLELLRSLDQRLERAVQELESRMGDRGRRDPYRGLYLSYEDVAESLNRSPGAPAYPPTFADEVDRLGSSSPELVRLRGQFGLSSFEAALVLVAVAPHVDSRYERTYAFLQDDVTRRRPRVELALDLLCRDTREKQDRRRHFSGEGALVRHGLIELRGEGQQTGGSLLSLEIHPSAPVANFLIGGPVPAPPLAPLLSPPPSDHAFSPLSAGRRRRLAETIRDADRNGRDLRFRLRGADGRGHDPTAGRVVAQAGLEILPIDLRRGPGDEGEMERLFRMALLEARLHRRVLLVAGLETVGERSRAGFRDRLFSLLSGHPGVVLLSFPPDAEGDGYLETSAAATVDVSMGAPSYRRRYAAWRRALRRVGRDVPPEAVDALADRFELSAERIWEVVVSAEERDRAGLEPLPSGAGVASSLFAMARERAGGALAAQAQRMKTGFQWEDLVLPTDQKRQLREICARVERRREVLNRWGFGTKLSLGSGVNALFAGPSGTGKTMAARVLAGELGLELYRIDLSRVVSKYIGETEKNLARLFEAAERSGAILLFDEADALFGKRSEVKDSHDRYANIEISYLLQRMEEYEGVTILATNLKHNMDDAFVRRMAFHVQFPAPGEEDRIRIWRRVFPSAVPLDSDLDPEFLGRRFRITGGNIRNVALAGSFLAASQEVPVGMRHLIRGVQREYQKMGKACVRADFEPYYEWLTDSESQERA